MSETVEIPDVAVAAATKAILDEGGAAGHSIHSWRCEYPDRYGECGCVEVTARAALVAARPYLMPTREALWEAIVAVRDAAPRVPDDADSEDIVDAVLALLNGEIKKGEDR